MVDASTTSEGHREPVIRAAEGLTGDDDEPDSRSQRRRVSESSMSIEVEGLETDARIDRPALAGRIRESALQLGLRRGAVTVLLVDDAGMADLNGRFHDAPEPTDVLTFDLTEGNQAGLPEGPDRDEVEVEIAVNVDEAARQAGRRGHEPTREALLYVLHGLLHCLGHDDHTADGFSRMHRREDEILEAIGVGATFGAITGGEEGPP